ncbi:alpha/beta hydrolase [Alteromonas sp. 5E99-2]|uniref:alpha/beta hydrolase-fold protein n=1 Tax=Alteromonas sp. 5E99-2 TaxID=2817683 RepID=UPI001A99F986|nr:alpha/beta hydrolase-fold protein [Alteromonas sp. 5E99-2]MBO1256679.1 alpha/beta hydrolase [Alteromonas sp. 5E99-2]
MTLLKRTLLCCLFMLCFPSSTQAGEVIENAHVINSKVLEEDQKFTVYLPDDYDEHTDHQYPVLYALDGKYYKQMVSAVIARFYDDWLIPDTIVVAIENEDRIRDYTPVPHATVDVPSGKADRFLDYIEKELIPFVESHYRTSEFRILEGHSLGGLLSLYTVQARPELFTAHYAFSPSLHWGDDSTADKIIRYISSRQSLNQFIYFNLGNEINKSEYEKANTMRDSFLRLQRFFNETSIPGLRVKSELFSTLPHAATNTLGLVHATHELYRNWVLPFPVMEGGPNAITAHYKKLSADLYYEVKPDKGSINFAADYITNGVKAPERGLALLKYNAELYPDSALVQFNLAKGYKERENLKLAKQIAEQALTLIALDEDELKTSITQFLEAL